MLMYINVMYIYANKLNGGVAGSVLRRIIIPLGNCVQYKSRVNKRA